MCRLNVLTNHGGEALFESDFATGRFFVGSLMARSPLSVLQILGFDMKLAVRKDFAGRAYFGHAVCVAFHILVRDEIAIFSFERAGGHKAIRGEIIKGNGFTLLTPD